MYEEQMSPSAAFIFYPPYEFKILALIKGIEDYSVGLNAFKVIH